ncbi:MULTISPECIES: VIT1/CCC1 transporter family protein [unclassified Pseudanabaena]|uniref:VIT1/CCC1 transporter family protein n=1 Tax=unclassified Pseudanabaena TaxID=2593292 RepID=UPI0006D763BC|nr:MULTISPECIES: VIT1/CCC1 transporter family protein [unclassified Pseudanabaena]TYQ31258.1 iron transporter [Pseudanabaena sp. UWO310]
MQNKPHYEYHFSSSEFIRDIVIGMSDGLTVPFALAAGLSGSVASTAIVVTAGFAEIVAGSIAMGLGGYLAAKTDAEHYQSELEREYLEVSEVPMVEMSEVMDIFQSYGVSELESEVIAKTLIKNPDSFVNFMMRFELGLEKPHPKRALTSAMTIAIAYMVGGLIPLSPYIFMRNLNSAFLVSIVVTHIALAAFGYVKGRFTGTTPIRSAVQTVLIGGIAAAAAFFIAKAISH